MANISTDAEIDSIRLKEQAGLPSTPGAGYISLFPAANGLHSLNSAALDVGPYLGAEVGSATLYHLHDYSGDDYVATLFSTEGTGYGGDYDHGFYIGYNGSDVTFEVMEAGGTFTFSTNEGSQVLVIDSVGKMGIKDTLPTAQLSVVQNNVAGNIPVLRLTQADVGDILIDFAGSVFENNAIDDTTAQGTYAGRLRISINGSPYYISFHNA